MRLLLIEDEELAARKLTKLIGDIAPDAIIAGWTDSIETSVAWLEANPAPDLILMDIELSDGQSFEIFQRTTVKSPVVFTTAYDEYALRAFKVNSIDYLLKPIREEDLRDSLQKFRSLRSGTETPGLHIETLLTELRQATAPKQDYRDRFLVKQGQKFITVDTADIVYAWTEDRVVFIRTRAGQRHIVDYTMDELEQLLHPRQFYRANRQFIIHFKSVESVHPYFNGKLKLYLKPVTEEEVVISREKAQEFRSWLGE